MDTSDTGEKYFYLYYSHCWQGHLLERTSLENQDTDQSNNVPLRTLSQLQRSYRVEREDYYEFSTMWKEVIMSCLKILFQHYMEGTMKTIKNLRILTSGLWDMK
jgi:hypothetical protein